MCCAPHMTQISFKGLIVAFSFGNDASDFIMELPNLFLLHVKCYRLCQRCVCVAVEQM